MNMFDKFKKNSALLTDLCALGLSLFFCLSFSFLLTVKYYSFGYYDWDFALYAQTMWNLTHGSTYVSLFGANFLANHAHYIAFLVAPVYKLFPHPLTLIHLKLLAFFGGAFIFYRIVREDLKGPAALILMLLYIFHPANIFMLIYEFHFESLAIPFLFLLYYFFKKNYFRAFLATAFLTCLIKENLPLVVAMFGVYGFFSKKDRRWKWGAWPFLFGAVFFLLSMFVVIPAIRAAYANPQNIYFAHYFKGAATQTFWQKILLKQNFYYLKDLFGPYFFPAILSPQILVPAAPIFAQNFLAGASSQRTIFFHYSATILPFVFLAAFRTIVWLRPRVRRITFGLLLLMVTAGGLQHTIRFQNRIEQKISFWADPLDPVRRRMVEEIPPDAGVVATFDFLSHLSQREHVYALYSVWRGINYVTGRKPADVLDNVDFALVDFRDGWLNADLEMSPEKTRENLRNFLKDDVWMVKMAAGDIVLFEKISKK